ncbi:BREX system Lon protease-like protein BrxL [Meridianimarinicoccus aquatilis]|uniref:BREX system Lon protease-like protein BrxL n=1 Tax=Meridianimarinicoccus aquatilis TaxID=2552766 RepID=UPI001FB58495|nr:BREX system Lon protease-like protein BrxL [Fluviibacterium aquatile]
MSGLLKLIFPNGGEAPEDVEKLLRLAMESRKRVKDQRARIDATYPEVGFDCIGPEGKKRRETRSKFI